MGHFHPRLSSGRIRESLDGRVGGQDQVEAALIGAEHLSPGRTPAASDTKARNSSFELRGLLQSNNRQMPTTGQVRHDQLEMLAAPPTNYCFRCGVPTKVKAVARGHFCKLSGCGRAAGSPGIGANSWVERRFRNARQQTGLNWS